MKVNEGKIRDLLRLLEATEPREIDCEEFLARVGAYLESLEPGAPVSSGFEEAAQHLRVCAECKEEWDALRRAYPAVFDDDSER